MAPLNANDTLRLAKEALDKALETRRQNTEFLKSIGPAIVDAISPMLKEIQKAVSTMRVDVNPVIEVSPRVDLPVFKMPEIKIPEIVVPQPRYTFNVPAMKIPDIHVPEIRMPDEMNVRGWIGFMGYDKGLLSNPLPVQIRDAKGNPVDFSSLGANVLTGEGGGSGGGNFPMATYDSDTSAIRVTGTVSVSNASATSAVTVVDSTGVAYSGSNPMPISGSVTLSSESITLDRTTDSISVAQVSDGNFSVNVVGPVAQGDSATAVRVVLAGNSDASVVVNSGTLTAVTSITNTVPVMQVSGASWSVEASVPNTLDVKQVSGASWSVEASIPSTLDVRQVSGANWSVSVSDIFGSTAANMINADGRIKVSVETGGSGLTDAELRAAHLDVQQVSGAIDSVSVVGFTASVFTIPGNAEGTAYNTDNPLPVTVPATLDVDQLSGAVFSVNNVGPLNQGDAATALRVVVAGNSDASVVVNSGTLTGITNTLTADQLSGATWSVFATNPKDQGDVATALRVVIAGNSDTSVVVNSGTLTGITNTLTVQQLSGAVFSVNNVGPVDNGDAATALRVVIAGNSDASVVVNGGALSSSATFLTRQANPTAVAADYVPGAADDLGRQLVRPLQVRDLIKTAYVSVTNGTETTLRAGVAGALLDLIMLVGSNNSDAAVSVDIRAVTAGNILYTLRIPANSTAGWAPAIPWPQDETGNNWTVDGPDETGRTLTFSALFSQEV